MSTTINNLITKVPVILALLLVKNTRAQQDHLESYIQQALQNNAGLKQEEFQLEKGLYALREARSLFFPNISLQASYIKSDGGRTIDFPAGDLLNPVYSTLNQLTQSNQFPQLENQSIQLNPDNFYDAKFRTTLPLVNAEIWYNNKIKKEQIGIQEASLNVYKRELIKDLKTAYYQLYQATQAVQIYQQAMALVDENIRVSESMLKNGVGLGTSVSRARAEREKLKSELSSALNNQKNARAYFNFLLNAPLDQTVALDSIETDVIVAKPPISDMSNREELAQLQSAHEVYNLNLQLKNSNLIPKLNTFLDLGSQGFDFNFDKQSRYYLWGINLQWDLFASGQNHYKAQQVRADIDALEAKTTQTEQALNLQMERASNNYYTAYARLQNAVSQLSFARQYFHDQSRLFKEGKLLYIELLDAQNELTNARLQQSISYANVQIALAELERSQASYPIP